MIVLPTEFSECPKCRSADGRQLEYVAEHDLVKATCFTCRFAEVFLPADTNDST
jgi:hypothetical protein